MPRAWEAALGFELGMFVAGVITIHFGGLFAGAPSSKHGGVDKSCHIFDKKFEIAVDSFGMWGLYTDTTRAGRRWRLLNAP
ncbi:hypothetical protein FHW16_005369 [Phyllobacterium myrsinacearum]|uniref:Uncharacterized protein n=1 Tax=Phyllobacterium myrsinacearum TaxID=28101 RepID=A0A839ETX2_9HYPH|nr:hypothetical protein [Phyllobacterium myrsinacearum]